MGRRQCSSLAPSPSYLDDDKHTWRGNVGPNGESLVVPSPGTASHAVKCKCQRPDSRLAYVAKHGGSQESSSAESSASSFGDEHVGTTQPIRVHVLRAEGELARGTDGGVQ